MTYVPLNTHIMLSICLCIFYLDTGASRDMCPCTQKIQNVMIGIIDLKKKDYRSISCSISKSLEKNKK